MEDVDGKRRAHLLPVKPRKARRPEQHRQKHANAEALADYFRRQGLAGVTVSGAVVTIPLHGKPFRVLVMSS